MAAAENAKLTTVRRKDREVTDENWICSFLERASFGVVGTTVNRQPFQTNVIFAFDRQEKCIYFHTATSGRLRSNIEANSNACFTAAWFGRLLPADTSLEFSSEYASVVAFGKVALADNPKKGLEMMQKKYFPHLQAGKDYRAITPDELVKTSVFSLQIEDWSGKKKTVDSDYPGATSFPSNDLAKLIYKIS